jgi:hypothetical protein
VLFYEVEDDEKKKAEVRMNEQSGGSLLGRFKAIPSHVSERQ